MLAAQIKTSIYTYQFLFAMLIYQYSGALEKMS